ncbi:hypothetical protein [Flagellimonas sp.]|uniref:hypothetical protein n=1 Tax=Flagellimonas sp. TaxID=2058762 RepID=UPI003B51994F
MIIDKLDYELHEFQRITWVSNELETLWHPIISQLRIAIENLLLSEEVFELITVQVRYIDINNVYEFKKKILELDLFCEHLNSSPSTVEAICGKDFSADKRVVIIGKRGNVIELIKSKEHLPDALKLTQNSVNGFEVYSKYSESKLVDYTWMYLLSETDDTISKEVQINNNLLNPFWTNLGISVLPFKPSKLSCENSLELAHNIKTIAKDKLPTNLYNAWFEILSWPVEWSALHGIAEVKTPILKMIYNTDSTGTKYTIRLNSNTYPQNGLNGLLFPYKKPKKLFLTESKKFNEGVKHLNNSIK